MGYNLAHNHPCSVLVKKMTTHTPADKPVRVYIEPVGIDGMRPAWAEVIGTTARPDELVLRISRHTPVGGIDDRYIIFHENSAAWSARIVRIPPLQSWKQDFVVRSLHR